MLSSVSTWPRWNLPDVTPERLVDKNKGQGFTIPCEVVNVAGGNSEIMSHDYVSPLTIDESKYSSLLRITVYCLKFIYVSVLNKCSTNLKEGVLRKYKVLGSVFNNMKTGSMYS